MLFSPFGSGLIDGISSLGVSMGVSMGVGVDGGGLSGANLESECGEAVHEGEGC